MCPNEHAFLFLFYSITFQLRKKIDIPIRISASSVKWLSGKYAGGAKIEINCSQLDGNAISGTLYHELGHVLGHGHNLNSNTCSCEMATSPNPGCTNSCPDGTTLNISTCECLAPPPNPPGGGPTPPECDPDDDPLCNEQ